MVLVKASTRQVTEKKNRDTKSLADHFRTTLASTLKLLALLRASTSFNKSNSTPFLFSSSTHFASNFPSSFSLSNSFSKWLSVSVLYLTAQIIPIEQRREQIDGIHERWQSPVLEAHLEEALNKSIREIEWNRKKMQ